MQTYYHLFLRRYGQSFFLIRYHGGEGKSIFIPHKLLMPDGSEFILDNEKEDTAERAGAENVPGLSPADNVSDSNNNTNIPKVKVMLRKEITAGAILNSSLDEWADVDTDDEQYQYGRGNKNDNRAEKSASVVERRPWEYGLREEYPDGSYVYGAGGFITASGKVLSFDTNTVTHSDVEKLLAENGESVRFKEGDYISVEDGSATLNDAGWTRYKEEEKYLAIGKISQENLPVIKDFLESWFYDVGERNITVYSDEKFIEKFERSGTVVDDIMQSISHGIAFDDDVQYQYGGGGHNGFDNNWHTGYTKAEIEYAELKAKNDAGSDENVIDNNHKWLYYNKNGRTYFALYSVSDVKEPTILYASKNNRAIKDKDFLDFFVERIKGENVNVLRSGTPDGLLPLFRSNNSGSIVSNGSAYSSGSNARNGAIYSKYWRNGISRAYKNCLKNIAEISAGGRSGGRFISDEEYMSAVKSGDMQLVEELIIDAAKYAGYNSPKLYHGTGSAVFTVFNTPYIFLSDSLTTSSAYAGKNRDVLVPKNDPLYNLHKANVGTIIDWLEQNRDISYRKADDKLFIKSLRDYMNSAMGEINGYGDTNQNELTDDPSKNVLIGYANTYKKVVAKIKNGTATKSDLVTAANAIKATREYVNGIETVKETIATGKFLRNELGFRYNSEFEEDIVKFVDGANLYVNQYGRIDDEESLRKTAREQSRYYMDVTGRLRRGNYALYAKMENPFIADARGQGFRGFDVKLPDGTTETFSTDSLAAWAKENGYDGVIIKNIYDTGRDDVYETATDYIVFSSNQVKSAEPIVYDDDRNIIPISERFKDEKEDIRNQYRTGTLSDRDVLRYAAENLADKLKTDGQKYALQTFNEKLTKLDDLTIQREQRYRQRDIRAHQEQRRQGDTEGRSSGISGTDPPTERGAEFRRGSQREYDGQDGFPYRIRIL